VCPEMEKARAFAERKNSMRRARPAVEIAYLSVAKNWSDDNTLQVLPRLHTGNPSRVKWGLIYPSAPSSMTQCSYPSGSTQIVGIYRSPVDVRAYCENAGPTIDAIPATAMIAAFKILLIIPTIISSCTLTPFYL
jgi:hypothetical protein